MLSLLLLAQAAAAPDIELNIRARARSVEIVQKGEAKLEVRGAANGSGVAAKVTPPAQGRTKLKNVTVDIRAAASVEGEPQIRAEAETGTPQ